MKRKHWHPTLSLWRELYVCPYCKLDIAYVKPYPDSSAGYEDMARQMYERHRKNCDKRPK